MLCQNRGVRNTEVQSIIIGRQHLKLAFKVMERMYHLGRNDREEMKAKTRS